jgi:hypothetical protein
MRRIATAFITIVCVGLLAPVSTSAQEAQPAPPAAPTLVSPAVYSATTAPTFTWDAAANTSHYYLWVNDSAGVPRFAQWFTANQVHEAQGYGAWSAPLDFSR